MNKKIIFIVILIVLFLILMGFYNFFNYEEKNEITNNRNYENVVAKNQENVNDNEEQNIENVTNSNESTNLAETETLTNTSTNHNNTDKTIVNQVSPSGFMGSSLYRVILYSNGEVYVEKFDGSGYEQKNIVSKDLIAKNVNSIKAADDDEHYGEVMIEGGEIVNNDIGWISHRGRFLNRKRAVLKIETVFGTVQLENVRDSSSLLFKVLTPLSP